MLFGRNEIQIDLYINYGNDNVRHKKLLVKPGINALDALDRAADVEYTPMKAQQAIMGQWLHLSMGSKLISITSGFITSLRRANRDGNCQCVLRISFKVSEDTRIAWRYHFAIIGKDIQRYGPLSTSKCISRIKRCNRQF